jgi:hypothetical protein
VSKQARPESLIASRLECGGLAPHALDAAGLGVTGLHVNLVPYHPGGNQDRQHDTDGTLRYRRRVSAVFRATG